MRTVFAALNAKYAHTNLAVRSVAAYCESRGAGDVVIWEGTVNQPRLRLLAGLWELEPEVVVFSCYIWNIGLVASLGEDLSKLLPQALLFASGPQVSSRPEEFLAQHPAFDGVLAGEGEEATACLLRELAALSPADRRRGRRRVILPPAPMDLDDLPFPYRDLDGLSGRTLYYESMRGCPFQCSYCLSSVEDGPVRYRSMDLVREDLSRFLAAKPRRVKFVDRTFNCDPARARELWRWLGERDNGVTCFHFELAGDLLDRESLGLLAQLRPGLVQFEIGVQSTNPATLEAVRRRTNLPRLFANARALRAPRNLHLHLDLIAGLPLEGWDSFARSFNQVYALGPDQLQLGFLKVLGGSAMEEQARGAILYSGEPPYQVLETRWLSFGQLQRLHWLAEMVERYYNSGRFSQLMADLVAAFPTPFACYDAMGQSFAARGLGDAPPSKAGQYEFLGDFMAEQGIPITETRQWLCRYDMAHHEKPRVLPSWVRVDGSAPNRERILAFYSREDHLRRYLPQELGREPKAILRRAHLEVFPFHPQTGEGGERAILFDYSRRDIAGRAKAWTVPLEKPEGM